MRSFIIHSYDLEVTLCPDNTWCYTLRDTHHTLVMTHKMSDITKYLHDSFMSERTSFNQLPRRRAPELSEELPF